MNQNPDDALALPDSPVPPDSGAGDMLRASAPQGGLQGGLGASGPALGPSMGGGPEGMLSAGGEDPFAMLGPYPADMDFTSPFDFGDDFDLGEDLGESEPAIGLTGADFERFRFRFMAAYASAKGSMAEIHRNAKLDREVVRTLPLVPQYPGGPDIRTPLTANKVEGVIAHLRDALEQSTIFTFSVNGTGASAAEAAATVPLREQLLEREINLSGSRERILSQLPREAVITGTGIAVLSLAQYADEHFVQVGQLVPIERFFVDRVNVDDLHHATCFYQYKERRYNLEEQAERGLLDADALAGLPVTSQGEHVEPTLDELENFFLDNSSLAEENTVVTLVRGYMRFRAEGDVVRLYECVFDAGSQTILALRENPFRAAFDMPPIALVRVGKSAGYLFGRGIPRRLEPIQKISDNAMNTHLALNNMAASPPVMYRNDSPFGAALKASGNGGIYPGMLIPTLPNPNPADVAVLSDFGNPGLAVQDLGIARQLAGDATYTEEAIGTSTDPRKTLGQFNIEVQRGTLRVRTDIGDVAYDLAWLGRMYDASILAFKLAPAQIIEVTEGGKLLSLDPVDVREIQSELTEIAQGMLASGEATLEDLQLVQESFNQARLTDGRIPFARRDDLVVSVRGTKIIADKMGELQILMDVVGPLVTTMIPAAREDEYANYFMRKVLWAVGMNDVDKLVPPPPHDHLNNVDFNTATMPFREMMMRSVVR